MSGTFYAIDGSKMRFDANGTADTGTIYMPDGTKYVLGHPNSSITDRNANSISYNESTRQWTDTLNRAIADPLPASPTVGSFDYYLPGLSGVNGGQIKYTFKWKNLADSLTPVGGSTPALQVIGSEYLPNPNAAVDTNTNRPVAQATQSLFKSTPYGVTSNGPIESALIVGHGQSGGQLFNPVVLSEIDLPDGTSYKFSYNVYGELDKVVYPTTAYDQYTYTSYGPALAPPDDISVEDQQPYLQSLRWISSRKQSINGTGSDILQWTYTNTPALDGGGTLSVVAPDSTKTVVVKNGAGTKTAATTGSGGQSIVMIYPFGFKDATVGMVASKKFYSAAGSLLRQEVNQYQQTSQNYTVSCTLGSSTVTKTFPLNRTPRLTRSTNIIFEGSGSALAQSTTFGYDVTNQYTTGIDQTSASTYGFVVVANATAQSGDLTQIPLGTLTKTTETAFLANSTYQGSNILGLPASVQIKDGSGTVVSRSEMTYDDGGYSPAANRALPTTMRTWDSTKGVVTNPSAFLVTHATFDTYGNRTIATDAKNFTTTTGDVTLTGNA